MDLTDRPADAAAPHQLSPPERAGDDLLARALRRARWTIFWERLWPALASITTVIGLFLALSWLGLWLWLPPAGRAIGLGIFFLLTAAAFAPVLMLRVPSHESARNRPMTVVIDASTGHSRSQKIVQRARRSARASKSSPARSCGESWWGAAASAGRSVKSISRKRESAQIAILTRNYMGASGQKEGTH